VRWAAAPLLTLGAEDGASWPLRLPKDAAEAVQETLWMMEWIMVWIAGEALERVGFQPRMEVYTVASCLLRARRTYSRDACLPRLFIPLSG
jgi:hypothetical protein